MITTTRDWKVALGCYNVPNRNNLVPANDLKIEYEQIDAEAQNEGETSANTTADWSTKDDVMNLSIEYGKEVATLELHEWVLDDSLKILPNSITGEHNGWVSDSLSGADGSFTTHPIFTMTWDELQTVTISGLTIVFGGRLDEYASSFKITAYNGVSAVAQKTFTCEESNYFAKIELANYDKIEIEINSWCLPYHRARIQTITMGLIVEIGKSDVLSLEQSMSSDLLSFALPDDYFTFEMNNVSEEWNPDKPTGRYEYLLERQRLTVKYAFKINGAYEWHTFGTYFMSEWQTPQNGISASFTGRSLVEFMTMAFDPTQIEGYTYGDSITLKALAENAFSQSHLPIDADGSVKWVVDSSLANTSIVIPYNESEVEGETTYEYQFQHTNAEVIQLCANAGCCIIRPDTNGTIHIEPISEARTDYLIDRFVAYQNSEYDITKQLRAVNVNNGQKIVSVSGVINGEEQSISNELVQDNTTATALSAWTVNVLNKRRLLSGEFRADPRLQPLDIITNDNKYARNFIWVTSVKWNYSGAFSGSYEGRVIKSIPLEDTEGLYYAGDTYAGGTW